MIPFKEASDIGDQEGLEDYLANWPEHLKNIPECVIEQWIYRHNDTFIDLWSGYEPENWGFELVQFDNDEVFEIMHLEGELEQYDYVGEEFIKQPYKRGYLADYMLENGTFPQPIIVAIDAGDLEHPRSHPGEYMEEPYQLIEGHRRLGLLRTMINNGLETTNFHEVWLMHFNFPPED
ncbi:hypothetical protein ACMG4M_05955 [Alcanivorax sp. IL3]|uniref:hypothetical protein n=1 Tax=Alcanivorax sp. IL3 TaxID=3396309 RepID=UPI0039C0FF0B